VFFFFCYFIDWGGGRANQKHTPIFERVERWWLEFLEFVGVFFSAFLLFLRGGGFKKTLVSLKHNKKNTRRGGEPPPIGWDTKHPPKIKTLWGGGGFGKKTPFPSPNQRLFIGGWDQGGKNCVFGLCWLS